MLPRTIQALKEYAKVLLPSLSEDAKRLLYREVEGAIYSCRVNKQNEAVVCHLAVNAIDQIKSR